MNKFDCQQVFVKMWASYPTNYRQTEILRILSSVRAGECVELIGLSGSGKSNLLGFLANRPDVAEGRPRFVLVDCNRLEALTAPALFQLLSESLAQAGLPVSPEAAHTLTALQGEIGQALPKSTGLCLLFDRFELILQAGGMLLGNLRALRDVFKYRLTYVIGMRHPLPVDNELAELFFGRTVWLGALSESDALWNIKRSAERLEHSWNEGEQQAILRLSGSYPALMRAVCEASAAGVALEAGVLRSHPAVKRRLDELFQEQPGESELERAGLKQAELLQGEGKRPSQPPIDLSRLTAKENLLLEYLQAHAGQVCDKNSLIQAVWPEDKIFSEGVRDESLAQLVRRLRKKIEIDPDNPELIQTVSNRGYLFHDQS
jgi:energy-coupling factor transporter ATP-binding protein EcfA2